MSETTYERVVSCCVGKHAFPNRQMANQVAKRAKNGGANPYKCEVCGAWHVGHSKPKSASRKRLAQERDQWRI